MGLTVVTKDEPKLINIAECEPGDIVKWEGDYWIVTDEDFIVSLTRGQVLAYDPCDGSLDGYDEIGPIYVKKLEKAVLYPYGND